MSILSLLEFIIYSLDPLELLVLFLLPLQFISARYANINLLHSVFFVSIVAVLFYSLGEIVLFLEVGHLLFPDHHLGLVEVLQVVLKLFLSLPPGFEVLLVFSLQDLAIKLQPKLLLNCS